MILCNANNEHNTLSHHDGSSGKETKAIRMFPVV